MINKLICKIFGHKHPPGWGPCKRCGYDNSPPDWMLTEPYRTMFIKLIKKLSNGE